MKVMDDPLPDVQKRRPSCNAGLWINHLSCLLLDHVLPVNSEGNSRRIFNCYTTRVAEHPSHSPSGEIKNTDNCYCEFRERDWHRYQSKCSFIPLANLQETTTANCVNTMVSKSKNWHHSYLITLLMILLLFWNNISCQGQEIQLVKVMVHPIPQRSLCYTSMSGIFRDHCQLGCKKMGQGNLLSEQLERNSWVLEMALTGCTLRVSTCWASLWLVE